MSTETCLARFRWNAAGWVLLVLIVIAPPKSANAYIDPNVAGPLYQMLFPILIAITSVAAAMRRTIVHYWHRLIGTVVPPVEGDEPAKPEVE